VTFFDQLRKRANHSAHEGEKFVENLHPRDGHGRFARKPGSGHPHIEQTYGEQWRGVDHNGNFVVRPTYNEVAEEISRRAQQDINDSRHEPYGADPPSVLQARARILSGQPTTRDKYSTVIDGQRVYDKKRQELHERIIQSMLRMHDGEPDVNGPQRTRPTDRKPQVFFTGGGYAAGKGGVVDHMNDGKGHPWKPQGDPFDMDPDKIKPQIPEFKELQKAGDPEANLRTYEEAWDIAQEVTKRSMEQGLDSIVDGVGDISADWVTERALNYMSHGYDTPRAVYVTTPVNVAIHNSRMRMEGAIKEGKLESIRYIPEDLLADTHAQVSDEFPEILRRWPGELELYDTNTWNDAEKKFDPPRLILRKNADGSVDMVNELAYHDFLDKRRYLGGN
jgi:hypothetical protein